MSKRKNDLPFLECSAKQGSNVEKAILTVAAEVSNKRRDKIAINTKDNNASLEEFTEALTNEINNYKNIVKLRCNRRQSNERITSINMLQNSITELNKTDRSSEAKLVEFISLIKGHISATLADHKSACCFGFFKLFTKPDLVRAYENVLNKLPKSLVDRTEAKVIDLDGSLLPPKMMSY